MTAALVLAWLAPLMVIPPALRPAGGWWAAAAAVPALAAAALLPEGAVLELSWLLLGTRFGMDETARVFLVSSALLWTGAAMYHRDACRGDPRAGRFRLFFLLAMSGNFLLVLAQDAIGFYLGFAVMGLAAYGLVGHRRSTGARRAARTYLTWTLLGELALFSALVTLAAGAPDLTFDGLGATPTTTAAVVLLVLGLGVKLALPGLHLWLPLAYGAAPAAGAAVLSGAMINAGLLGWLRFLPLGQPDFEGWGGALVVVGLTAAFYGVAAGLLQRRAKLVLAYSSISQMGLLTGALGLALAAPERAPLLVAAATLYALHHGLAKGALFLALDARSRSASVWVFAVLVFLALTLAGAPLTSGALAKAAYKSALPEHGWMVTALWASTVATTLLMARFLALAWKRGRTDRPLGRPGVIALLSLPAAGLALTHAAAPAPETGTGLWPLTTGLLFAVTVWLRPPRPLRQAPGLLPPGDLPALAARWTARIARRRPIRSRGGFGPAWGWSPPGTGDWESRLRQWPVGGSTWLLLCALLLGLLIL